MHTDVGRCLGKAIADARQQAELTPEQLAAKINISTRMFQAYEGGEMLPRYKTVCLRQLCVNPTQKADNITV